MTCSTSVVTEDKLDVLQDWRVILWSLVPLSVFASGCWVRICDCNCTFLLDKAIVTLGFFFAGALKCVHHGKSRLSTTTPDLRVQRLKIFSTVLFSICFHCWPHCPLDVHWHPYFYFFTFSTCNYNTCVCFFLFLFISPFIRFFSW